MRLTKLGEICNVSSAGDKPTDFTEIKTAEHTIPVVANGIEDDGIIGYTSEPKISRNAVTISARGNIGTAFYRNYPYYPVIRLITVYPKNGSEIDCQYLYYLLKNSPLKSIGSSVQAQLTVPIASDVDLFIEEDYKNQQLIAAFLGTIDNKISTNNKIIETSEKLMREIYDYWFVQFDFPDENGRPYKSSGGEMVYDEKLKREIPKGWKVQNLLKNDLCKDIKPGIDKFDNTKTYYATADVIDGEMGIGAQIDYGNRESRANMQPKPDSVWFAKMKNSVKHITVMPTSDDLLEKSVFSTGFFGLKCEPETLSYIRGFIYSDYFEKVKDLNSNGATMEAISNDGVKNVKLIVPDEMTLKKYSNITNACLTQNDILRKENAKLVSLRDWLLPMLMNGQIKVSD